ncbi:fibrillarin-like rRNA methylase [Tessaracoccus terricola]
MSRERIAAAFAAAPRPSFLPEHLRADWRLDQPLPLVQGQTNSQPSTVFAMLELLDVEPGMKVLDVGSGSGWTTALLAELVGPQGRVIGVERVPALVEHGRAALGSGDWPQAEIRAAEQGRLGVPAEAPFDRILVSAMAGALPASLVEQLADGGVMVVPVDGRMTRVTRRGPGSEATEHGFYVFVPLVED